jgi:hypothetical protein
LLQIRRATGTHRQCLHVDNHVNGHGSPVLSPLVRCVVRFRPGLRFALLLASPRQSGYAGLNGPGLRVSEDIRPAP